MRDTNINAGILRSLVLEQIGVRHVTAADLADELGADLGHVKCALKALIQQREVVRSQPDPQAPPVFGLVPWKPKRRRRHPVQMQAR